MLRGSLLILLCANFVTSFQPTVSSVSKIITRLDESKQHPSSSIPNNVIRNQRIRTWSPYSSALFSSPDSDLEMINEDGEDDEFVYVTAEPFESEADIAQAANELAATNPSIELKKEIERSFLQYALSIILGRALPDARDGLKPVHRRILYAMHQLNLAPSGPHRKCARVVGEVLGKYHPHGDMAVYDALVRMAQDFTTNYRLIDGHGNFGSVDADPAAAMRYTECRLTKLALDSLMTDLSENTVDLVDNFDGNEKEPLVLPSKLPLLLLNGSSGIAVGMATNVPPHNLREIMNACKALVGGRMDPEKEITDAQLVTLVPGPDFPTRASILGTDGAKKLYTTGNGGVVMRAVTEVENVLRGKGQASRTAIIVKELPYQVNKASLLEKIAALVNDKKLDGIADLRDESDRDGIRVVLELKRDAVPNIVLNNLYKKTQLQSSFSGNFLALLPSEDDDEALKPQRFTLREALDCFLDFRFKTIRRKTANQLEKVEKRAHIVDGLLIALEKVDEVIELVRSAPDQASAREALMDPDGIVKLSYEQADSVLKLQLGQLTRLNQGKLEAEKNELVARRKELKRLLEEDDAVYTVMIEEFDEMDDKFGEDRKTVILNDDGEVNEIDMVTNSRSVIVVTSSGYIKRMPLKTFESQGRGTRGKRGASGSMVDDEVSHVITCNDHDTLLMIAQNGVAYGLRAYQVPTGTRTAKGTPIPSVLPVNLEQEITTILPVSEFSKNEYIVLTTEQGWIKRTPLDAFETISARGLTIASLDAGDQLKWCHPCTDDDDILIASSRGQATRFSVDTFRPTGRTSRGVRAMKLKAGDTIADMDVISKTVPKDNEKSQEYILCMTKQGYGKRISTDEFRSTSRGVQGVIATKFKKGLDEIDKLSCFCIVREEDEILINTAKGVMVRQKVANIPSQGRSATGVVVQKVDDGDEITSVSLVPEPVEESGELAIY